MTDTNAPLNDLLADLDDKGGEKPTDLLNEIDDSGAQAWVAENAGDGIQGVVLSVSSQPDQYPDPNGTKGDVPVIVLKTADGDRRILGFATILRREIREKNPQPGDTFAVKYLGKQEIKKGPYAGSDAHIYRSAVRKAPASTQHTAPAPF